MRGYLPFNKKSNQGASLAVQRLRLHCRGYGFNPWSGNYYPISSAVRPAKKEKETQLSGMSWHRLKMNALITEVT